MGQPSTEALSGHRNKFKLESWACNMRRYAVDYKSIDSRYDMLDNSSEPKYHVDLSAKHMLDCNRF